MEAWPGREKRPLLGSSGRSTCRLPRRPANGLAVVDAGPAAAEEVVVVVSRSENPDESDVAAGE